MSASSIRSPGTPRPAHGASVRLPLMPEPSAQPPRDADPPAEARPTPRESEAWRVVKALGPANLLAIGALALPPLGGFVLLYYLNSVGDWLRGHEEAGVALYIAGFAVFSGLSLLPTYTTAILGGWAFGFGLGFPAALAGFLLGSLLAYGVCRAVARDRAERVIEQRPLWRAVRDALIGSGFGRTLGIVALIRLPFNSPFAATNLVFASVKVPLGAYLLGTLVGMAPRTGLMVYLATQLKGAMAKDAVSATTPWWYWALGAVLFVVVVVVIASVAKRAVAKVVGGMDGASRSRASASEPTARA